MSNNIFKNPLERIVSDLVISHRFPNRLEAARQVSQEAIEFAVRELGASRPKLSIKPLPEYVAKREGIRGYWDKKDTAYVTLPPDKTKITLISVHETGHPIRADLWIANAEYHNVIRQLKEALPTAKKAANDFYYMDLRNLSNLYNQYKENETVSLGSKVITRSGKFSSLYWCGIDIHPHEVLSKPYKLEEVQKSFSSLPERVRETVSPIIQPVLDFHRLLDRKNDLERLDEGWCEFFAYVFAQHKGLPIDMSQIRENRPVFGIGIDEYVMGSATYAQGMYKLVDWAQKRGDPIAVLRESLQIRSTQEMDNVIAKSNLIKY
jgi:hypothetical protein|tara:strand:- start:21137 stop:22099 length:963 start_codon:yes stop_codon:yes gene_type:complete